MLVKYKRNISSNEYMNQKGKIADLVKKCTENEFRSIDRYQKHLQLDRGLM